MLKPITKQFNILAWLCVSWQQVAPGFRKMGQEAKFCELHLQQLLFHNFYKVRRLFEH
ncbi:hypothetical protein [Dulcicalothrix desertica]|uniref:hypothetical protein n=1 Tax=Dulcicalothrix desertica TaxID=32056 RepID=UPI0013154781|nr:hypothetical protein [Dulcicalothrix desertica]